MERAPPSALPRPVGEAAAPRRDAGATHRRNLRDVWTHAGEQARGIREGAEQVLRVGRELARLPVDLLRALRAAAREG